MTSPSSALQAAEADLDGLLVLLGCAAGGTSPLFCDASTCSAPGARRCTPFIINDMGIIGDERVLTHSR